MSWEDGVIDVLAVVSPVVELLAWNNKQTQISFHAAMQVQQSVFHAPSSDYIIKIMMNIHDNA